jgi:hypothetical protein
MEIGSGIDRRDENKKVVKPLRAQEDLGDLKRYLREWSRMRLPWSNDEGGSDEGN